MSRLAAACLAVCLAACLSGCGAMGAKDGLGGPAQNPVLAAHPDLDIDADDLEGEATWYGERHQGRRTASGEPFDRHDFTCAHRTLPFDAVVRVTRLDTRQSVVVRVNDRGPYGRGRVVDLSEAAAEEIELLGPGHTPVFIEVLALPEQGL